MILASNQRRRFLFHVFIDGTAALFEAVVLPAYLRNHRDWLGIADGGHCRWLVTPWQWVSTWMLRHATNWHARNPIPLCSYSMATSQKSKFLSALVDKGRKVIGKRSTQSPSLPGETESATNSSPSTTSHNKFKKSNDARRDMNVLALTYILRDCTTIRELILLIISLNDHDDSGKVCTICNPS